MSEIESATKKGAFQARVSTSSKVKLKGKSPIKGLKASESTRISSSGPSMGPAETLPVEIASPSHASSS